MRTLLCEFPLRAGDVVITGDEAHHGRVVLRLAVGDAVRVADGAGSFAEGVVSTVTKTALCVHVEDVISAPALVSELLTVAVAAPKGDRFTDLVRGLTELGVGAITPLICARGERVPGLDRARRVAAEALKQCRRVRLPSLGPVAELPTVLNTPAERILLDPDGQPADPATPRPTVLIIGPEGGFTPEERAAILAAGARPVRLAAPILRIETAALAAAAVWIAAWEGR